jgi:hypothetical protein
MGKSILLIIMVVAISLVFTVSCVTKEVPVTETYYETEYRTESYVEIGYEESEYIEPEWTRQAFVGLKALEWVKTGYAQSFFDGYDISLAKDSVSQVELKLRSDASPHWGILVVNLTGLGPISAPPGRSAVEEKVVFEGGERKIIAAPAVEEWLANLNAIVTDPNRILNFTRSDQYTSQNITVVTTGADQFMIWSCVPQLAYSPVERVQLIWQSKVTKERQVPYQVEKQRTVTKTEKVPFWELWKAKPVAEEPSPPSSTPVTPEVKPSITSPQLICEDDFSNPNSGWEQASTAEGESYYKDGEFHGLVKMWDWSGWQYNRNAGRFKDFIMEEDARLVSGPKDSAYGLIFRCQSNDNFYRFLVSANGSYVIGTRLDSKWTELQGWTVSPYINQDNGTNHLKVICKGSQIEVYVNGYQLAKVIDDSFADGYIGGIIYASEPDAHVAFDNLKVYNFD